MPNATALPDTELLPKRPRNHDLLLAGESVSAPFSPGMTA